MSNRMEINPHLHTYLLVNGFEFELFEALATELTQ